MLSDFVTQKLTRLFHLLDTNKNGVLEQADYDRAIRNLAAAYDVKPGSAAFTSLRQKALVLWEDVADKDRSGDGRIPLEDWLVAHDKLHGPDRAEEFKDHLAERAMATFELMDPDGNSRILLEDLQAYVQARFGLSEAPWVAEAFSRMDVDGNGFLTFAEAIRMEIEYHFSEDPKDAGNYLYGAQL